jgi:hypothetical protein
MSAVLEVDVTAVLQSWFATDLEGVRVGTETPADPNGTLAWLPFLQHFRIGGPDDGYVLDIPTIALHGFDRTAAGANGLLLRAGTSLRDMRGVRINNAVVTRVRKLGGPSWAASTNPAVKHAVSLYQLRVKAV